MGRTLTMLAACGVAALFTLSYQTEQLRDVMRVVKLSDQMHAPDEDMVTRATVGGGSAGRDGGNSTAQRAALATSASGASSAGMCGNGDRGDGRCPNGQCCSRHGHCGVTEAHCSPVAEGSVADAFAASDASSAASSGAVVAEEEECEGCTNYTSFLAASDPGRYEMIASRRTTGGNASRALFEYFPDFCRDW